MVNSNCILVILQLHFKGNSVQMSIDTWKYLKGDLFCKRSPTGASHSALAYYIQPVTTDLFVILLTPTPQSQLTSPRGGASVTSRPTRLLIGQAGCQSIPICVSGTPVVGGRRVFNQTATGRSGTQSLLGSIVYLPACLPASRSIL